MKDKTGVAGGFKAIQYVMACAHKVGPRNLAAAVKSKNACKACAFGTGGQRGGLHNEYTDRIEICNKNIQAHTSDIKSPIPSQIFQQNTIEELNQLSAKQLTDLGRLGHPLYKDKGDSHYRVLAYDQAIKKISNAMKSTHPDRSFFYGSGRSSNEAAFVLQLFARIYGSNHINNCSYYCHQASGVGLNDSIGTGTATIQYADLYKADLIFVIGANPASNHPRFVKVLLECRQRGGKVIVINPARETGLVRFASPGNMRSMITGGGDVASLFVQPHVGGDVALLSGIAKCLISSGEINRDFIDDHTSGFEDYVSFVEELEWDVIVREAGVSLEDIENISALYVASEKTVFTWGMGLTHHLNGTENIEAIANLALLRGMIGGEGRGLLPLRGHSNVQGVGSMGFTPQLKEKMFKAIEEKYEIELPSGKGMDTLACVQAAARGDIDFALLLGGNLHAANPDTVFSEKAMSAIPFKVMISSTLNETHLNGVEGENIVLPIRVRDEENQSTTQESMFNYLRMSDGGFNRIASLLSEVEIITRIAVSVIDGKRIDFKPFLDHRNIRIAISRLVPGFQKLADIDETKNEFHIEGRKLDKPKFSTRDGRAHFKCPRVTDWSSRVNGEKQLVLTSVRSEGQFNTIIYDESDRYRGKAKRNVLFVSKTDLDHLGMQEGERVNVENSTGKMKDLVLVRYDIKPGNVMTYFPEANVVVPQSNDVRSRTPSFKSVLVSVTRSD
ncbi:MAG: histidine kinase [Gammaproteobacteria bacterium]|nr:histidine kinase [Gammaproteobacteria bacterium]